MNSEVTGWLCRSNEIPEYEGVYECRDLNKPDEPNTFCYYKDGWLIGAPSVREAYRSKEKYVTPSGFVLSKDGSVKTFTVNRYQDVNDGPQFQWRGLAKRPVGVEVKLTKKWR